MPTEQTFAVALPFPIPTAERIEDIYREEFRKAIDSQLGWLSIEHSARYIGYTGNYAASQLSRNWKRWGLPRSEHDGIIRFCRKDLDAFMLSGIARPKVEVIPFPSLSLIPPQPQSGAA